MKIIPTQKQGWSEEYMWQSRIEIEYYSITYFERITKFDAL